MIDLTGRALRRVLQVTFAGVAGLIGSAASVADTAGACALLSKAEVKAIAPWPDFLDQLEPEEERLPNGSACNYPSVYVQVMTLDEAGWKRFVAAFQNPTLERLTGIGDEAYVRANGSNYGELLARMGARVFTTQHSLDPSAGRTLEVVKPEIVSLGQALAATLR
jgi:hypothetical protein